MLYRGALSKRLASMTPRPPSDILVSRMAMRSHGSRNTPMVETAVIARAAEPSPRSHDVRCSAERLQSRQGGAAQNSQSVCSPFGQKMTTQSWLEAWQTKQNPTR